MGELSDEDNERVGRVASALGGDVGALRELTKEHLGTRDLDEADRRALVIREWRSEHDA